MDDTFSFWISIPNQIFNNDYPVNPKTFGRKSRKARMDAGKTVINWELRGRNRCGRSFSGKESWPKRPGFLSLIKPIRFDQSLELTPPVQEKVDPVIDRVLAELDRLGATYKKGTLGNVSCNPLQNNLS